MNDHGRIAPEDIALICDGVMDRIEQALNEFARGTAWLAMIWLVGYLVYKYFS